MKKIGRSILLGFFLIASYTLVVMADAKSAANYAREAARQAATAYAYAQKINYNSTGRVKYYARQIMDAAQKAERAANQAYAELGSDE